MNCAILLTAGLGQRFSNVIPKCFIKINDKYLFEYSLDTLLSNNLIDQIVLVVHQKYYKSVQNLYSNNNKIVLVLGGSTRQESTFNALKYLKENKITSDNDNILIFDGARPLVTNKIILDNINALKTNSCCVTCLKISDTVLSRQDDVITSKLDRDKLLLEQTPASFKFYLIYQIHCDAKTKGINDAHDDVSLAILNGNYPNIVDGDIKNFKVTYPEDLILLKFYLNYDKK